MKAQDFLVWMDAAECQTAADVIRTLGCGRNQAEAWVGAARQGEEISVKRAVALAMAAVAAGLTPWPEGKEADHDES